MALSDLQWGQILALTWLEKPFKIRFELDPKQAFDELRDPAKNEELRKKYGDFFVEELGLKEDDIAFIDVETMTWDGTDFAGMSGAQLQQCINGAIVIPPAGRWFWGNNKLGIPLVSDNEDGQGEVLSGQEWGRLYSRIWMDHRINESDMDPEIKKLYGPQKGYLEQFEKDPAGAVTELAKELNISFNRGETRLYRVLDKPADWGDTELSGFVKSGQLGGQTLVWIVNKCC